MGQYREKSCPYCGTKHRKKGPYCSRSCGNHRAMTPAHRAAMSKSLSEVRNSDTPAAEFSRWMAGQQLSIYQKSKIDPDYIGKRWDDYNVIPSTLEGNQFVADNAIWSTDD